MVFLPSLLLLLFIFLVFERGYFKALLPGFLCIAHAFYFLDISPKPNILSLSLNKHSTQKRRGKREQKNNKWQGFSLLHRDPQTLRSLTRTTSATVFHIETMSPKVHQNSAEYRGWKSRGNFSSRQKWHSVLPFMHFENLISKYTRRKFWYKPNVGIFKS